MLLGSGILSRRARHLLGTTLLLTKIVIKRNVVGELVFALVRGNVIHDTEHRGYRRLIADRTGRIGKNKTVGNDIGRIGERHKRSEDRNDPKQNLQSAGERQNTQNGDGGGDNRGDRQHLGDERAIRRIRFASEELGTRRIVMGDNNHRTVARRCKRTCGLVIGNDILTHARLAQARDNRATGTLEHIQHGTDDGQQNTD